MKLTHTKMLREKHLFSKLFVVLCLLTITPIVKAQNQQVQITGTNITLRNAFDQIEKQTNFSIDYDAKTVDENHTIKSIPKANTLSEVITDLLQEINSTFTITSTHIIITPKPTKTNAQARRISGVVIDKKTNEALIGANILVKGTSIGTVTDFDGKFSLDLPAEESIITFNYVGYLKQELEAPKSGILKIELEYNSIEIDEVVVVGYGTVKKSDLTGSIGVISSKNMRTTSVMSADQALQGRMAGVTVTNNSGAPGGGVSIKIRGTGGFGNTDPLYIVDGMPIKDDSFGKADNPSGISYLNPNDIESIQVLKDASSAAIYGTRGANGVIIITTKKGSKGGMKVDLNSYYGIQQMPRTINMCNSQQFATLYNETGILNQIDPTTIASLPYTDWLSEITQQAPTHNEQLSISGGKDGSSFYISINNFDQQGIVKRSGFNRQSVRINTENQVNKWLKVGESFTLMHSNRDRLVEGSSGVITSALKADPTILPYDSVGNWSYLPRLMDKSNPVANVELTNYNYKTTRIQGSFFAEIEFFKNLKYKFNGGLDNSWGERREFLPSYSYGPDTKNDDPTYTFEQEKWNNWLIENTLSYSFDIKKNHFDLLLGYTTQFERKEYDLTKVILSDNNIENRYLSNKLAVTDVGGGAREWSLISQLSRINYSYADKYLVTASVRRDGSSRFGANKKYGIFPSASVAWKISSEEFFQKMDIARTIDLLKIRVGYGQVGNQNIPAYVYNGSVSNRPDPGRPELGVYFGTNKDFNSYFAEKTSANPDIGWETSSTLNFGLDGGLFNNKLSISVDVYNKETSNILMEKILPLYFGQIDQAFGKPYVNLGAISNKGFEISATFRNSIKKLNYEISANISKNINKVLSLNGGQPPVIGNSSIIKEGLSIGTFYGYKVEGIFQNDGEITNHAFQNTSTKPGDLKFQDSNKDGKIDAYDRVFLGNAFPNFNYGITLSFNYKEFDLAIFGQGVAGNTIYNQLKQNVLHNFTIGNNVSTDMLNAWGRIDDNGQVITNTNIPKIYVGDKNNNRRFSDYYLESGSYFRIKSISLGYTLKKRLTDKLRLSNLRLYCTLQNVLTFTKYSGFDPEIGQSTGWNSNPLDFGADSGAYPQSKIYMFGVNVSF